MLYLIYTDNTFIKSVITADNSGFKVKLFMVCVDVIAVNFCLDILDKLLGQILLMILGLCLHLMNLIINVIGNCIALNKTVYIYRSSLTTEKIWI